MPHVPVVVSSVGPRAFCPVWLKSSGVFLRLHKKRMFYLCFKMPVPLILHKLSEISLGE
jgi:hypothetical protein